MLYSRAHQIVIPYPHSHYAFQQITPELRKLFLRARIPHFVLDKEPNSRVPSTFFKNYSHPPIFLLQQMPPLRPPQILTS